MTKVIQRRICEIALAVGKLDDALLDRCRSSRMRSNQLTWNGFASAGSTTSSATLEGVELSRAS